MVDVAPVHETLVAVTTDDADEASQRVVCSSRSQVPTTDEEIAPLQPKRRGKKLVVAGAGMANLRFAVAAADWESVGGAWAPESDQFAAELVEVTGMAARTELGR